MNVNSNRVLYNNLVPQGGRTTITLPPKQAPLPPPVNEPQQCAYSPCQAEGITGSFYQGSCFSYSPVNTGCVGPHNTCDMRCGRRKVRGTCDSCSRY